MNTKNTIKKIAAVTLAALAFAFTTSAWADEPVIMTPADGISVNSGAKVVLPVAVYDVDGAAVTTTLSGTDASSFTVEDGKIYYTGGVFTGSDKVCSLTVTAANGANTTVKDLSVTVKANRAPVMSPSEVRINAARRTVGNYLLPLVYGDPDGDAITSVTVDGSFNFSVSDGYVYFKASNALTNSTGEKTYNITVTLTDAKGASATYPLKVIVNVINGTIQASYAVVKSKSENVYYGTTLENAFNLSANVEGRWLWFRDRDGRMYYSKDDILPVGTYAIDFLFDPNDDSYRAEEVKGVSVTILPRAITLLSGSATKEYDGTPQAERSVSVSEGSLIGSDTFYYTDFARLTEAGTVDNTYTVNAFPGTDLANYTITKTTGTLTVEGPAGYDVMVAASAHGTVTADRTELIQAGDKVTLTVTPAAGYALDALTVTAANGDAVTLDDGNAFLMPEGDVTVSATFRFVPVTTEVVPGIFLVQPQNGTVAIAGTGAAHSLVTLTPTPDEGYALGSLAVTTAGGETLKLYEGNTFYMPEESVTVTATFADARFENKVRLEPNSTYLYTLTVPEDVWNAANKEFLQTLVRVYTGEGCALALSSELSGSGTLTTTPADGFSATCAMVASNGVMKTTITIKTGAVASYAAFSAVSQGAEYGEADSAKRAAAQAALKSATLAKATVTQETSASGGGNIFSDVSMSRVNGHFHPQNGYTPKDGNPNEYPWKIFYNDSCTDETFPGTYDLEPNSEYTFTMAVPKDVWKLDRGQYLQVEVCVFTAVPNGNWPAIMLGSRPASEKPATDPKVKGDVREAYIKEDGTTGYKYPNGNGYNTGSGGEGYEAESWMTVRDDGMVETKVVMKIGADGGHLAINFFSYGEGWTDERNDVADNAIANATLVKTPTETVTEVATETESSFSCGEGGKTVTTTYLTDFNVGTGRWSDTAAALADDGNSYSTDGLKALDSEIEYAQPHTITIAETENGTVTADGTGAVDARITLTVTPAENYKLDTLAVTTANGATITLDDGNAFIMPDEDITIEAAFVPKAYAIACAAAADGAISVPETADAGSTVTLKFNTLDFVLTADTLAVTAAGENVALTKVDAATYTFTMPDGAVQVDATYTAIVTQPVLQTEGGEEQLTIPADWRETYKLRNSQVTNVTQKLDNGMTAWQSYVLGRDPTNVLSGIYADVEQDDKTDTVTIEAVGLDENTIVPGFGLTYRLEKTEEPGFLKENAVSPEFDVGIAAAEEDPTGHYKLSMVVTRDGTPVEGAIEAINTVGIVKQTQAATNAIISVPWSRLAPGQDQEIQVSEVVKTANLDEGDELRVYRPGSSTYESYTLDANRQWVAAKTFKVAALGSGSQSDAPEAPAATITRGSGIWLCRKDPSKPYFLYGQSNGADESKVTVVQGPNLIGATGTENYDFNVHILNAQEGDVIMVPGTGAVPLRYEFKDGVWGRWGSIPGKTVVFKGKTVTTSKTIWKTDDAFVAPGTGFWLHNNSGKITVK